MPVFTAGGTQAEIRQQDHKLAAAVAARQEVLLGLQQEVQQARVRFQTQLERRSPLLDQLAAAEDGSKLARTRYRLGLGNIVEVQQTEIVRLRAAQQLLRNRAEIWLAWVELQYVTGRLAPEFLEGS